MSSSADSRDRRVFLGQETDRPAMHRLHVLGGPFARAEQREKGRRMLHPSHGTERCSVM